MKLYIFILACMIVSSCEETVYIDGSESHKKIVINSIISTDSTWNVNLSYSKSIFDVSEFTFIEHASTKVTNQTSGQSFFLKHKENGNYQRALNPTEGHTYELEVTTIDGKIARATTYVPSVLKVDVIKRDAFDSEGKATIELEIEIEDNPTEENFYVWEVVENIYEELPETPNNPTNVATLPIELQKEDADLKSLNSLLFISDKNFDGTTYKTKLTLGQDVLAKVSGNNNGDEYQFQKPRFSLNVMAVSKDLYEYMRTYEIYKQTEIKITSISQPVDVYSNIENGLGIFGGFNRKEFPIQ